MLTGERYQSAEPDRVAARHRARRLMAIYSQTDPVDTEGRAILLKDLFGHVAGHIEIEPPFFCDYGYNIHVGEYFYANTRCVILDGAAVHIGNFVSLGPNVHIYTTHHPVDPTDRLSGVAISTPVTIGNNVWIGGNAIIMPGITIGSNTTIGAGSIVTHDIPDNVLALGSPCRVIRQV